MKNKLVALRQQLREKKLDGFIIPHADEHQSEYTPSYAQRLCWISGFNGSAGQAALTLDRAAIFVDGRYTLQVREQVDVKNFTPLSLHTDKLEDWLIDVLPKGGRVGYDPWLHTRASLEKVRKGLRGIELVPVDQNPIDQVWEDRPGPSLAPAVPHLLKYSGEAATHKRERIAAAVREAGADAVVLSSLDSIAWLLNIRGSDVDHTPLVLSFAILKVDGTASLFVAPEKISPELKKHLGKGVKLHAKTDFEDGLKALGKKEFIVQLDETRSPSAIFDILENSGATVIIATDPCVLPKACKNDVELDGTRAAHIRDAVALCRFLAWVDTHGPSGKVDEIAAADKLLEFRKSVPLFQDTSFTTITGAGPNGAIVHYRVTPETSRMLDNGMIYLVDSGGQYLDGTTDVTRTIAIGKPTEEQKDRFTRVLKGHIALAQARFPKGRTGGHLDVLARKPLWDVGLDYDHGTGHGVGSFLGVHEGPQNISEGAVHVPLVPGMILSNEPGYYKSGEYGIRIENLVIVRESDFVEEERPMLTFETITFAPIDRRLINPHMMTTAEITWYNIYHAQVRDKVAPHLKGDDLVWLMGATESLIVL